MKSDAAFIIATDLRILLKDTIKNIREIAESTNKIYPTAWSGFLVYYSIFPSSEEVFSEFD